MAVGWKAKERGDRNPFQEQLHLQGRLLLLGSQRPPVQAKTENNVGH